MTLNKLGHSKRDQAVAWSYVAVQGLLLVAIVFLPRDTSWITSNLARTIGSTLFFAGVGLGIWSGIYLGRGLTPSPLPNGSTELVVKGPYAYVRHPMYTAVIALSVGITFKSGSVPVLVATIALIGLFAVKARWEEAQLALAFPGYERYMEQKGRFLPGIGKTN
jgi:protein-S-isoprenylcysteine O-methyltransferase Ste14